MEDSADLKVKCLEAIRLLQSGHIDLLANQYGYALAFGRPADQAIHTDLSACLHELGAHGFTPLPTQPEIEVSFFTENASGIAAVIECLVETDSGAKLLVEFISTEKGIILEHISTAA
ncbi:MAG: hypothetical protein KJ989_15460 [Gammaproteobacteria bacterium]|nr:hypothetical protein [Gammaproteobacteria bacterium]MBU2154905.1 hypothetical protein [Gammaproteobacteria bacterium]MBU2295598.1 hypothetical protein [Gammaproteobacteria bacterium]